MISIILNKISETENDEINVKYTSDSPDQSNCLFLWKCVSHIPYLNSHRPFHQIDVYTDLPQPTEKKRGSAAQSKIEVRKKRMKGEKKVKSWEEVGKK